MPSYEYMAYHRSEPVSIPETNNQKFPMENLENEEYEYKVFLVNFFLIAVKPVIEKGNLGCVTVVVSSTVLCMCKF